MLSEDVRQLRRRVDDWDVELRSQQIRGTLTVGIAAKALLAFESVLTQAVSIFLRELGPIGNSRCRQLIHGKSFVRASLGDKCVLIRGLRGDITQKLVARGVQVSEDFGSAAEMKTLNNLVQYRNKLVHGKMGAEGGLDPEVGKAIAAQIGFFCDSTLLRTAILMSEGAHSNVKG